MSAAVVIPVCYVFSFLLWFRAAPLLLLLVLFFWHCTNQQRRSLFSSVFWLLQVPFGLCLVQPTSPGLWVRLLLTGRRTREAGRPRIRKNVESGRGWYRQRLNVTSRQPALSFIASQVPAGLAMKNRATERRFRGRRRLPEGAEIQKLGGLKFDLLLSAFLLFWLACDFI